MTTLKLNKLYKKYPNSDLAEIANEKCNTYRRIYILGSYKKYSSTIEKDGDTPLLLMSRNNWNFLYEGIDFDTTITGNLNFKKANNL